MGWIWMVPGLGLLVAAGFVAARRGLRQEGWASATLAAVVVAWGWATLGVEALGSFGVLRPLPLTVWSALGLSIAATMALRPGPPTRPAKGPPETWEFSATLALGLVFWSYLCLGLPSLLLPVKVVSDGPIYHLYLAARWWKEGRVFPVATPFGEVGATYFWANGEAWFAWLMTLEGGDRIARVGQVPFLAIGTAAAYAIARRLGAGASSAAIASAWFATITPLVVFGCEPNVDAQFVAGYLLATFFFLRYALEDDGAASLALGGLAGGLTWGTKPTGIVFVPVLLTLAGVVVATRRLPARTKLGHLAVLLASPCVGMGYWPIRNVLLTGNPLYPLHLSAFGTVLLRGWFDPEVMRFSPYFIPRENWRAFVDILVGVADPRLLPGWLAALGGAWWFGRRVRRGDLQRAWAISGLALLVVALYWLVIPYRTQQRFMLPAFGLAVAPLALTLDRGRWLRVAATGLLALHVLTPQPWPLAAREDQIPWDLVPYIPNAVSAPVPIPTDPARLAALLAQPAGVAMLGNLAAWGLGSMVVAWAWSRLARGSTRGRWAVAVVAPILVATYCGATILAGSTRSTFPPFPDYAAGWAELEARSGPEGARVAYAGTNIPYYLMGGGLRNDVLYVNVDGHRGWLMHDYHRAARSLGLPETWDNPYVGWDRMRPDYDAWLANLHAEGIQLLVTAKVNPAEGRHNVADRDEFPIERGWAESHPESFQPLYGVDPPDPRFRLFRVLPKKIDAAATDRAARSH